MTSPADELRAAAARLRPSSPAVATHTVRVWITSEAASALARLLDLEETYLVGMPENERLAHVSAALAVARAVLGSSDG